MRQGNFSELLSPTNYFYGKAVTIKDPSSGVPFPNNIIPAGQNEPERPRHLEGLSVAQSCQQSAQRQQ